MANSLGPLLEFPCLCQGHILLRSALLTTVKFKFSIKKKKNSIFILFFATLCWGFFCYNAIFRKCATTRHFHVVQFGLFFFFFFFFWGNNYNMLLTPQLEPFPPRPPSTLCTGRRQFSYKAFGLFDLTKLMMSFFWKKKEKKDPLYSP